MPNKTRITKVTFNIPTSELNVAKQLANDEQITMTTYLRKAINTLLFLDKEQAKGNKILIREQNGSYYKVVWK